MVGGRIIHAARRTKLDKIKKSLFEQLARKHATPMMKRIKEGMSIEEQKTELERLEKQMSWSQKIMFRRMKKKALKEYEKQKKLQE